MQAKQVPLELERDRLEKERDAALKHNEWLDGELAAKATELRELKTSHAAQLASLQTQVPLLWCDYNPDHDPDPDPTSCTPSSGTCSVWLQP